MRASSNEKRVSPEETTRTLSGGRNDGGSVPQSKPHPTRVRDVKGDTPVEIHIQKAAPPDPEILSKIGCRCLVIDLPGVLYENMTVNYVPGFVRVEGKRTVGRIKSFRKKYPLNHDQVVTRMISAFLCQGVLVIAAPTKVAASMAAAAIVATQLIARGYSISKPPTSKKKTLLLMPDPATVTEGPVKFSNDLRATAATSVSEVIDCRQPSAFAPYVSAKSLPFDEPLDVEGTAKGIKDRNSYSNHGGSDISDTPPAVSPERNTNSINEPTRLQEYMQDTEKQPVFSRETEEADLSLSCEDQEKPAVWSDDSLLCEPSVSATKSLRIMEGVHIDSIREERIREAPKLSPIMEYPFSDPYEDSGNVVASPDIGHYSQSSGRPLTWVQFDSAWQDKEESLMVDTAENHSRVVAQLQQGRRKVKGTTATIGVPIMLPFEDELMDRDDHGLRMELEPHPYWRSAPFLPRDSSNTHHMITIDHSIDAHGPVSAFRDPVNRPREHRKPPSPSLRRKSSSPTTNARRKCVTWVDEI